MMTTDTTDTPPQPAAVGAQVQRSVRPTAGPNMRRMLRAARLCEELGHGGDTLAALEELKALRGTKTRQLTDAQIDAAVYAVCPEFDQWHEGPSIDDVRAIVRRLEA